MSTNDKVSERRRYKRYEINLNAIVAFEGAMPYAMDDTFTLKCNILDFCTHGLFLEIRKSFLDLSHLLNQKAKVLFPVVSEQGKRYARVDAQVVRIGPKGIGVAFERISESVFRALMRKSRVQHQVEAKKQNAVIDKVIRQEPFKVSINRLIDDQVPIVTETFFKRVRQDLELGASQSQHFKEESIYLDAIRDLRFYQTAISQEFRRTIASRMDFLRISTMGDEPGESNGLSLSLIDKDDFEEWLNISISTKKIATQFEALLGPIAYKLSHVTGIPLQDLNNPLSPVNLFESFKHSIGSIEGIVPVKQTLYKAFESALIEQLPELYQAFDILLNAYDGSSGVDIDNRITSSKEKSIGKAADMQSHGAMTQKEPGLLTNVVYDIVEQHLRDSEIASGSRRHGQSLALTAAKLLDLIDHRQSKNSLLEPSGSDTVEKTSSIVVEDLLYSQKEIIDALSQLQIGRNNRLSDGDLQACLTEILNSTATGNKHISEIDRKRLDIAEQLFETLMQELTYVPCIKPYLDMIHLPLISLALVDSTFLDAEEHPARKVVNQLFELESAVRVNRIVKNQDIRQTLDRLLGRIVLESAGNPAIFAWANEELKVITQALSNAREVNIRRVIEACEGKQKLDQARVRSQQEIDRRLAGKSIPIVVKSLLDLGWQHLLVMAELDISNNVQTKQELLNALDDLVVWLTFKQPFNEAQLETIRNRLLFMEEQLAKVCNNRYLLDNVIDELKASLLGTGSPARRKPVPMTDLSPTSLSPVKHSHSPAEQWLCRVDRLQKGQWFSVVSENGDLELQQLIWIGQEPRLFVLVNREGHKKQELSRERLAELLASSSISEIGNQSEPPMERASGKMLQSLHDTLMSNASYDPVTKSLNRREFLKRLRHELAGQADDKQILGYLEILDYRMINNVCGTEAGDELLRLIAGLIESQLHPDVCLGRLGDKNFGFLIRQCSTENGLQMASNIRDLINRSHFKWLDKSYSIGVSIGLTKVTDDGYSADDLLQQADAASITAKRSGHNRIRLYQDDDAGIKAQNNMHEWAGRIDRILHEKRLFTRCQKIAPINLAKQSHSHYEILLGIRDEDGKVIAPGDFLPAVEHCQRMPEIDFWVADTIFTWVEEHKAFFENIGGFAINLSGQSLNSEEFLHRLVQRMKESSIPFKKITFEVTETVASNNLAFTESFIQTVKQFGCKFSLDDFGTGYSSYSYLKNLNVDYLKIDGSFVKEITGNPTDVAIVRSMNEIAHSLGLETIAEYVETEAVHDVLKEIGVDYGQGWTIHKPVILSELVH